eukprot:101597-Chlamydomonas_euryale.AAC.2
MKLQRAHCHCDSRLSGRNHCHIFCRQITIIAKSASHRAKPWIQPNPGSTGSAAHQAETLDPAKPWINR